MNFYYSLNDVGVIGEEGARACPVRAPSFPINKSDIIDDATTKEQCQTDVIGVPSMRIIYPAACADIKL